MTLYPMFYSTRMVTMEVLRDTFEPHMHPEAARRGFAFIESQGGHIGVGGGYRAPGEQPDGTPGFAPPGKSFHEGQQWPSGLYYAAWDLVAVNPGNVHRSPNWSEVPEQGSSWATQCGVHANVSSEAWHLQPIEIDGYDSWVANGRQDLQLNYPIAGAPTLPPTTTEPIPPPEGQDIIVEFTSRTLREGDVGTDVEFFQKQMNDIAGQGLTLDGQFGRKTTEAVMNWQRFFGLTVDGILGPASQRSMIEVDLLT